MAVWYGVLWLGLGGSLCRPTSGASGHVQLLWLAILSFLLLHTFYWTNARMRAPLTGVIVVLSAVGWQAVFSVHPEGSRARPSTQVQLSVRKTKGVFCWLLQSCRHNGLSLIRKISSMICISLTPSSRTLAPADLLNASRKCDMIELCLDSFLKTPDIASLLKLCDKPVVVSCRRRKDGGN